MQVQKVQKLITTIISKDLYFVHSWDIPIWKLDKSNIYTVQNKTLSPDINKRVHVLEKGKKSEDYSRDNIFIILALAS